MEIVFKQIGVIHTSLLDKNSTPIQASRSDLPGRVEVFPEYLNGLEGIEGFSHIYLLYGFHLSEIEAPLLVQPFLDDKTHGIFATRYPVRPNPLGLSVVRLLEKKENILYFLGADMLDNTPLLDIKPYISEFDVFQTEKNGWYEKRKYQ
jgi:tRNA-Thr(GGU) m(6)t(6)A37 methyltransferase TsaA